jgi:hypothetical protein
MDYVVRLNDGSCVIGEADSGLQAREEFVSSCDSSGSEKEELILCIREMPKDALLSRWWPSENARDEGIDWPTRRRHQRRQRCVLSGIPDHRSRAQEASDQMACFSDGTAIHPSVFDWDAKIRSNLTEAVRAEMRRGNLQTKSIQEVEWDLAQQSVASETRRWERREVIPLLSTDNRCAFSRSCDQARVRPAQKRTISKRMGGGTTGTVFV